jgi:hypothetical protein
MAFLSSERLLSVWEQGVQRHPIDRALLLFALAVPDTPVAQLADLPLSRRNAALIRLYRASFGERLTAWVDCPACAERMEFATDVGDLPLPPENDREPVEVVGLRFYRPTSRHLAQLIGATDPETAARQLLRACAETPEALPREGEALTAVLDEVERSLDDADPWADITVAVRCPACAHEASVALDMASLLWEEIDSRAQRLLGDVHTLARAYGWTEPEVLALSATRRAAYLARVQP